MHLESIFISSAAGAPMVRVEEAEAAPGQGLAGDRYCKGTGYYSRYGERMACQITLIQAEALERMALHYGISTAAGEHRRNLVLRGADFALLRQHQFRIGPVLFAYTRDRPPCAYLGRRSDPLLPRAMGEGAGICASVVEGGLLQVGSTVEILSRLPTRRRPLP